MPNNIITGSPQDDDLSGGVGADEIYGLAGNDILDGGAGNDPYLSGGEGNDTIYGGLGNDEIYTGNGTDHAEGGDGDDKLSGDLTSGSKVLSGGAGNDQIWGGNDDDVINGGDGDDSYLDGFAGNDTINGDEGDDQIWGGIGDDIINGGNGNDPYLSGGEGNDTIYGGLGNDEIYTGNGTDHAEGGDGDDKLSGDLTSGSKVLSGGAGNDQIWGGNDDDVINGGDGDDSYLDGFAGNDTINGDEGDDQIWGGIGDDVLSGGAGVDFLYGGEGNDTYRVSDRWDSIWDDEGSNQIIVSANHYKTPSNIENITFEDGAKQLPYWIDAVIYDSSVITYYNTLLNDKTYFYHFPDSPLSYFEEEDLINWQEANAAIKTAFNRTLVDLEGIVDLTFLATDDPYQSNTIAVSINTQIDSAGYAQPPDNTVNGSYYFSSDIFIDTDSSAPSFDTPTYDLEVLVHELGHALGLKHTFDPEEGAGEGPYLPIDQDNTDWTVMSYTEGDSLFEGAQRDFDIAALQYIYGVSPNANAGDSTYTFSDKTGVFVYDGQGFDSINAYEALDDSTIYLSEGAWSFVGQKSDNITSPNQMTINFGTKIEDAYGSRFNDLIVGNQYANTIFSGSGNDVVQGGIGDDYLNAGTGNNWTLGGAGEDFIYIESEEVWGDDFIALNVGSNESVATGQRLKLDGMQRFSDIVDGGGEYDVLMLTDDADAIFIDDIYSEHNDKVELIDLSNSTKSIERVASIEEIQCGLGDDLVDLTTDKFNGISNIKIFGEEGNDVLWGSKGDDIIIGGVGDDILCGASGLDSLWGGEGADIFQFTSTSGNDMVFDFDVIIDTLEFYYLESAVSSINDISAEVGLLSWDTKDQGRVVQIDLSSTLTSNDIDDYSDFISFYEQGSNHLDIS